MKRFGPAQNKILMVKEDQVFRTRLHLLLIMTKAALQGYPLEGFRKKAALENAAAVHRLVSEAQLSFLESLPLSHLFKERIKLLSIMATAIFSGEYPLGVHRREAIIDNMKIISEQVFSEKETDLIPDILKVA